MTACQVASAARRFGLPALGLLLAVLGATPLTAQDTPENPDENKALFANFLHNAVLGKFDRADNYAKRLIANHPDPSDILRYADEHTNSLKTLVLMINKVEVSESAQQIMALIHEGELASRQDPQRIKENIAKLGGDPQSEFNAINRLVDSGEYAVPWLVRALQDDSQERLHGRIIRMLPKMGKDAVNPLVISLRMDDPKTKQFVVRALGEIGYPQALPYLMQVREDPNTSSDLRKSLEIAIARILIEQPAKMNPTAAEAYLDLARQYYEDNGSVRADSREDLANVWYWVDGFLERTEVPREIFNEIMTMRCTEESMRLADNDEAIAYWLAANIRREAELGLDVESVDAAAAENADPTKADDFPRSAYFARASGARYCHMVLDLALKHREPAVALGAIAALRRIAGETNLVGAEDYKQPLAAALTFPALAVRIKAALALAHALPATSFSGAERVVPALSETLALSGGEFLLVIEPDQSNLNRVMGALRNERTTVIGEASLYDALERARQERAVVNGIFLATDVTNPEISGAVGVLRANNVYAMTPIILLTKQAQGDKAEMLAAADPAIATAAANGPEAAILRAWQEIVTTSGSLSLEPQAALDLSLDAVDALIKIAQSHSTVYNHNQAEPALIAALSSPEELLQKQAAAVLAMVTTAGAQRAIARMALDETRPEALRVSAFESLAHSAKINGNQLEEATVDTLIKLAIEEPNLTLRAAEGQALGALNIPSNKAGRIIERFYKG